MAHVRKGTAHCAWRHGGCPLRTSGGTAGSGGVRGYDLSLVLLRHLVEGRLRVLVLDQHLGGHLVERAEELAALGDPRAGHGGVDDRLERGDDRVVLHAGEVVGRLARGQQAELLGQERLRLGRAHELHERDRGGDLVLRHPGPDHVVVAADRRAGLGAAGRNRGDAEVLDAAERRGLPDVVDLPRAIDDHGDLLLLEQGHHGPVRVVGRRLDRGAAGDEVAGDRDAGDVLRGVDDDLLGRPRRPGRRPRRR